MNLYHAWSLQGELRHPLQLIETFEAAPGAFSHAFDYPEQEGEGLIVYAWVGSRRRRGPVHARLPSLISPG